MGLLLNLADPFPYGQTIDSFTVYPDYEMVDWQPEPEPPAPRLRKLFVGTTAHGRMRGATQRKLTCSVPGHGCRCSAVWEMGPAYTSRASEKRDWMAEAWAEVA